MSRVTHSHSMEFGATEPPMEGFGERGSFLDGLFKIGQMFKDPKDIQSDLSQAPVSVPQTVGEVPRLASKPLPVPVDTSASASGTKNEAAHVPQDETGRLVLHITSAERPAQACHVLISHLPLADAPLGGLDCAAFASQFARALSMEGRTILVIFGQGSGRRLGLSDLVAGRASFSQAIHRESGSRLHILPSGHGRVAPGEELDVVMDALAETYDFVVLAVLDEEREAAQALALSLAPRANHAVIGCASQSGSPDMSGWHHALEEAGARDILAVHPGATRGQELAA